MSTINNISFYDSLCKLSVGALILTPLYFLLFEKYGGTIVVMLFVVLCYIVGALFHHFITENVTRGMKNDVGLIRKAYRTIHEKELPLDFNLNNPNDYFKAYYLLEQKKMLGTVRILESTEAFFRNLAVLFVLYFFTIIVLAALNSASIVNLSCNCTLEIVSLLIAVFDVLFWILRYNIQEKIHELVWEGYLYTEKNNHS